ncbi:MAG TPA: ATP-binding protein, partial [Pilimelia sp.]|nr:ATP-binding protein [Pilimelia sp.]
AAPATEPGGPTGPGAGPPDFVGRRAEIEMLLGAPLVPLVHLVGPAGAGKSALLAELGRRAPGRVAVGSALGAAELRLSWLHSALVQLDIRGPAALAVDQAMAAGRSLTPAELNGLAEAITERGPVLLGVDDAAALDERSVAELGFLVRHGRGAVCLTVALRCDAHLRDLPVAGLHDAVVLHLRRLTPAEVRGGADQDAAEGCGGIPALLAALHRPRPVAMATAVHLVGLRTRGLPAAAARILRTCATLGPLRIDQVAGLIELPVAEVLRCTDELLHAELLDEVPGGRIRHSSELVRAALAEQVSGAHTNYLRQRLKGSCA